MQERENALSDVASQYLNFVNENDTLISELKARMDFNSNNHEVLVLLRQGYVEVAQEAVVTDYSDACLINRNLIEERNVRIRELGDKKVGVLDMIKELPNFCCSVANKNNPSERPQPTVLASWLTFLGWPNHINFITKFHSKMNLLSRPGD